MLSPELIERVRNGDRRALAKAVTVLEADPGTPVERDAATPVVGVTGPPGVGKSTLINALISDLRRRDMNVAVLAFDPSSPLTGGALLGDRIRMQEHIEDPGVYVRSMATRGRLGGLADSADPTVALVTTAGFDVVIVETVGVGQSEVDVMNLADVVVLVLAPGWGDQIQADKAGVVEIADLFVINKGDRTGVDALKRALIEVSPKAADDGVFVTVATDGSGVEALADRLLGGQPD